MMLIAAAIFMFIGFLSMVIVPLIEKIIEQMVNRNDIKELEVAEIKRANELRELALGLRKENKST
jgi:hypothetical protein